MVWLFLRGQRLSKRRGHWFFPHACSEEFRSNWVFFALPIWRRIVSNIEHQMSIAKTCCILLAISKWRRRQSKGFKSLIMAWTINTCSVQQKTTTLFIAPQLEWDIIKWECHWMSPKEKNRLSKRRRHLESGELCVLSQEDEDRKKVMVWITKLFFAFICS